MRLLNVTAFLATVFCACIANGVTVTYSTSASQLCVGAAGCGVASQIIGGPAGVMVTFNPVASASVNANPSTFGSLGEIVISCTVFGTGCGSTSLAGLNLFINITQSQPTLGFASIVGGVISGSISGTASSASITWSTPNAVNIGTVSYALLNNPIGLLPPSVGLGTSSVQATITASSSPVLTYSPPTTQAVVLPKGGAGAINVTSAGAAGSGSTSLGSCGLVLSGGANFSSPIVTPVNGVFNATTTSGSISLACTKSLNITTARLICSETPNDTGTAIERSWQIVCPNMGIEGLDVDGNGFYTATTDGVLIVRYLLGMRGPSLIANAIGANPTRANAAAIEGYLQAVTQ